MHQRKAGTRPTGRFTGSLRAGVVVALALSAVSGGCLFSTRTPQPPYNPEAVPWDAATEPEILLQNIKTTFEAKQTANYDRAMAQDFVFHPDPIDSTTTGGSCFLGWNRVREITIFSTLFKNKGKLKFSWSDINTPLSTDRQDEEYYHQIRYRMAFSAPGPDTAFVGKADLYVRNINGEWKLFKWLDSRSSADTLTLGMVRCKSGELGS